MNIETETKFDGQTRFGIRLNFIDGFANFQKFWYKQVSPENNQDGYFTIDSTEDDQNQDDAM